MKIKDRKVIWDMAQAIKPALGGFAQNDVELTGEDIANEINKCNGLIYQLGEYLNTITDRTNYDIKDPSNESI